MRSRVLSALQQHQGHGRAIQAQLGAVAAFDPDQLFLEPSADLEVSLLPALTSMVVYLQKLKLFHTTDTCQTV